MTNIITSPSAYQADIANATDTVTLGSGNYGAIGIYNVSKSPSITVTAAPGAIITAIECDNLSGVIIKGLDVGMSGSGYAVNLGSNPNLVLDGLNIHQADNATYDGIGVFMRNNSGVTVQNCTFSYLNSGTGGIDNTNVIIKNNTFHNLGTDGNLYSGVSGAVVSGNSFRDFNNATGGHPDAIQFFDSATFGGPNNNNQVLDNFIEQGTGDQIQGIFIENGTSYTIARNAILGGMSNGISLAGTSYSTIADNLLQAYPDGHGGSILMRTGSNNVIIDSNVGVVAASVTGDNPQPSNITVTNVSTTAPMATITDYTEYNTWKSQVGSSQPIPPPTPPVQPTQPDDPTMTQLQDTITALQKDVTSAQSQAATEATALATANATIATLQAQVAAGGTSAAQVTALQTKIKNALAALNAP